METRNKIKMTKGTTVNMGNYNSFRVDFEIERYVDEESYEQEVANMSLEIDRVLQREVENAYRKPNDSK